MTPEGLFAAFFGGGSFGGNNVHHHRSSGDEGGSGPQLHFLHMIPVVLLLLLTLASNFSPRESGSRFSFTANGQYRNERTTATLSVNYYVTDAFEDHYMEGSRGLADFERQVETYHVRNLYTECDHQEKVMYKKVMMAKRRGNADEIQNARSHPRPACKRVEEIKRHHQSIYRSAMHMSAY
mmetsp:Transcript_100563/g.224570  ORF Transcript_100563/g.224570 Transcript_100563/m.224570 type:complete len:181 (-) Transcript_100563:76-618(-)